VSKKRKKRKGGNTCRSSQTPQQLKREYELEEPVALVVEKYATFIDSTPDHVSIQL